ncbi:MAG: molybdopterin-dependent oxidoreductase [Acidobacteriia bacterium]|nr:molybdopterin-dependent oxidoreductase [Terriglobia bacterium]
MKISRRDLFKFVGGSAVGAFLTPIPWKLIDDAAIWSQNWSWIPRPLHGEIRTKFTTCTLCPAGCGARVRCVGDQPVMLTGVTRHPVSRGTLCPAGLGGHHLPYHPGRALQPLQRVQKNGKIEFAPVSREAVEAALAAAISRLKPGTPNESIVILDQQPGRTISRVYRRFLESVPNGVYVTTSALGGDTLCVLQEMMEKPYGPVGYDLENTRMILSFGAPLLDGWGTPGRMMEIIKAQGSKDPDYRLKIIQVETRQSRTASFADEWVAINPGTEAAFALGLAHVLIHENLYDQDLIRRKAIDFRKKDGRAYLNLVEQFTPEYAAGISGIAPDRIIATARTLAQNAPAIVIGGGDPGGGPLGKEEETAIAGLNLLLGGIGRPGGIVARREVPDIMSTSHHPTVPEMEIRDVPDHSIRILILDAAESGNALPWALLERKLVPQGALVVSLSSYLTGLTKHAGYIIPAPTYLESIQDVPAPIDATTASFSLSSALLTAPAGVTEPFEWVKRLASVAGVPFVEEAQGSTYEAQLKNRVETIYRAKRGTVFSSGDGKTVPIAEISSADQLWKLLSEGGCWIDSKAETKPMPNFSLLGKTKDNFERLQVAGQGRLSREPGLVAAFGFILMPFGWRGATGNGQISPLMTKLFQESGLRKLSGQTAVNPETGRAFGLTDGGQAWIETEKGAMKVEVRFDAAVMPRVIEAAVGPSVEAFSTAETQGTQNILDLCHLDDDCAWRVTRARVTT